MAETNETALEDRGTSRSTRSTTASGGWSAKPTGGPPRDGEVYAAVLRSEWRIALEW